MFVPIILGSDKMTVSVGTGHNQYWPVYLSIRNIHNNVRRAHWNGLVLLGFLAIPASEYIILICLQPVLTNLLLIASLAKTHIFAISAVTWNDKTRCRPLPRWPFSTSCVWYWTIHSRLSRASPFGMCCAELVPTFQEFVYNTPTYLSIQMHCASQGH